MWIEGFRKSRQSKQLVLDIQSFNQPMKDFEAFGPDLTKKSPNLVEGFLERAEVEINSLEFGLKTRNRKLVEESSDSLRQNTKKIGTTKLMQIGDRLCNSAFWDLDETEEIQQLTQDYRMELAKFRALIKNASLGEE